MRAIWNGHITFGLISIPVSLFSAVEASEHVSFRLVHRKDRAPIKYKKFCSAEDIEVPNDEIAKGYEVADDEFVLVEKEELEEVQKEMGDGDGQMEMLQFVEAGSVNPLSYENPYYLAPRKGGEKAYGVLRDALVDTRRIGIARFPLHGRSRLAAVLPGPEAIAVESLRPFEELRDPSKLPIPASTKKSAEVKMAKLLIDQMSTEEWDPAQHPNEYRKALEKLLASKRRFALKELPRPEKGGEVIDLMAALKKSLGQTKSGPKKSQARRTGAA
ncbi:MAG TPA: Ku protein [Thermoanaerobaculia bacterium]